MDKPREITIHQSVNRPQLLLGCDRELILFAAVIAAALAFSVATWWGVVAGVTLWLCSVAVLSRVAKADPLMKAVYLRHIKYQHYYPACARFCGATLQCPPRWIV